MSKKPIYLDYAAATPVAPEVMAYMKPYFSDKFGNSGSLHSFGQEAQAVLDRTRTILSGEIGADFNEIIFTSSASEANDLIVDGIFEGSGIDKPKIIISDIEHESVNQSVEALIEKGAEVVKLPVSKEGFVDPEELTKALDEKTILVSIIFGSNEIGTIQPIEEIGQIIQSFRREHNLMYPVFHTDAVQAISSIKIDVKTLGIDAATFSSQKIYGPKGAGALYISNTFLPHLKPQLMGGGHEFGLRASTPNTPAIAGFGRAVELLTKDRGEKSKKLVILCNRFLEGLRKTIPDLEVNGSMENRLPNNLNIYFPGREKDNLVIKFDLAGVAVSAGSACSVRSNKVSKAVLALGHSPERAGSSIRFTLGDPTTAREIDEAVKRIERVLVR
ncbi:MAG: cysteine desulfurase [Candidatus Colwellbacteria bacterium]|nr:cysteine desulfurase [Candidatus Colwellbacteria bacterium]